MYNQRFQLFPHFSSVSAARGSVHSIFRWAIAGLLLGSFFFAFPLHAQSNVPAHVPGALIVKIQADQRQRCLPDEILIPAVRDLVLDHGLMDTQTLFPQATAIDGQTNALGQSLVDISLIYQLRFPETTDIPALAQRLSRLPAVAYAEPRYLYTSFFTPDDPLLASQWYIDSTHAPGAWNLEKGDTSIVIGMIDTGTSFAHDDLKNQVAYNTADPIDGIDNDNDGFIDNYRGWDVAGTSFWAPADNDPSFVGTGPGQDHGVLVTGAACAEPNNSTGIAGLGYNTHFMPLKAAVDQSISISFGYDAIVYAADHGAHMVNLSWGSGTYTQYGQDIVNYAAINKGVLVVAASGNRHQESFIYPASFANVLSVGGTQVGDQIWDAQTGTGTTYNYLVDLTAPAAGILTTAGTNGYWGGSTGTSMASPLVCAGAALLMARFPQLSPIQAGELTRVGAEDIYGVNPAYLEDRMGTGQLDVLRAMSLSNPRSVRIDSLMVRDDENDIAEPFDTMQVYTRLINYLNPVQNLQVEVESMDTSMVEILQGSASIGAMGSMTSTFNPGPFLLRVKKNVTGSSRVFLKFTFTDGTYTDYQYFSLRIMPTSLDLDQNKVHTSINGIGNIGFADFPANQIGLGYLYNGSNSLIQDGGFVAGISQTKVVDNLRGTQGSRTGRFAPQSRARRILPGPNAALEATARFDDSEAGSNEIGLDIEQHAYQFNDANHDQYIILEYTLRNRNSFPINGVYNGLNLQLSQIFFGISSANYYPGTEMIAALASNGSSSFWTGMALITDQAPHAELIEFQNYGYTDIEKFNALSQPATSGTAKSGDLFAFMSGGPVDLAPGDSAVVAFVIAGGSHLQDLSAVVERARERYWCELKGQVPQVSLGNDLIACSDAPAPVLQPQGSPGVDYLWSNGATTSQLAAGSPGIYSVTVANEYGCEATDQISVEFRNLSDLQIGLPFGGFNQHDPLNFRGLSNRNNLQWSWDFGDGNTSIDQNPFHAFNQPGSYTVSLTISDGFCSFTTDTTIQIAPLVAIDDAQSVDIAASPNPFSDVLRISVPGAAPHPVQLRLLDVNGRVIWKNDPSKASSTEWSVDGQRLPSGMYFLEASSTDFSAVRKLIRR